MDVVWQVEMLEDLTRQLVELQTTKVDGVSYLQGSSPQVLESQGMWCAYLSLLFLKECLRVVQLFQDSQRFCTLKHAC